MCWADSEAKPVICKSMSPSSSKHSKIMVRLAVTALQEKKSRCKDCLNLITSNLMQYYVTVAQRCKNYGKKYIHVAKCYRSVFYHTFISTFIITNLMSKPQFSLMLSEYSHDCYWNSPVVKPFASTVFQNNLECTLHCTVSDLYEFC